MGSDTWISSTHCAKSARGYRKPGSLRNMQPHSWRRQERAWIRFRPPAHNRSVQANEAAGCWCSCRDYYHTAAALWPPAAGFIRQIHIIGMFNRLRCKSKMGSGTATYLKEKKATHPWVKRRENVWMSIVNCVKMRCVTIKSRVQPVSFSLTGRVNPDQFERWRRVLPPGSSSLPQRLLSTFMVRWGIPCVARCERTFLGRPEMSQTCANAVCLPPNTAAVKLGCFVCDRNCSLLVLLYILLFVDVMVSNTTAAHWI